MFARTTRLLLRPPWPEDAATARNLAQAEIQDVTSISDSTGIPISGILRHATMIDEPLFPIAVLNKRTSGDPVLIGTCALTQYEDGAELRFYIAQLYRGIGYAEEAAQAMLNFALANGLREIYAKYPAGYETVDSQLNKMGFRRAGSAKDGWACMQLDLDAYRRWACAVPKLVSPPYDSQLKAA